LIFGTVGTHTAPFDRLVRALDGVAGATSEEVVVQTGASRYPLRFASGFVGTSGEEFGRYMRRARIIVTHGGDTVLEGLDLGKPVVLVPRRHSHHEHIDDHQVELADALAVRGMVTVTEPENLLEAISRAKAVAARSDARRLIEAIRGAVEKGRVR
jgi:UDP-N-acetylglucosamine transferase subunit ALG13